MSKNRSQLVRDRMRFTNEPYTRALDEIRKLNHTESLIPDASPDQAEFEASILDKIGHGSPAQSSGSSSQHPFGIADCTPRKNELLLTLAPSQDCLKDFAGHVAPFAHVDTGLNGVAGLRLGFTHHGDAVLHRLHHPGKVILRGVSRAAWNSALYAAYEDPNFVDRAYQGDAATLHSEERYSFFGYPLAHRSEHGELAVRLLSRLLRRAHAFRTRTQLRFTDLWFNLVDAGAVITVEWAGDLDHATLIARLLDRRFGLPMRPITLTHCYCEPCSTHVSSARLVDCTIGATVLNLRRSDLYNDVLPPRRTGRCDKTTARHREKNGESSAD
ncbi:hypothetical protein P3102_07495 [Amycolatopsis sp. QT-25]|uniref:hypothetical protein n=1 Tax=Amycolatopsis sp. QT-25 TaxID=3034022 RepID=UPI0023EB1992|nr:hypothetical protein [Amycolatopsis sp. QT-25]WET81064.1 hypothetical protein P3102_07495 [Amycolatopsis sp. QT-25]